MNFLRATAVAAAIIILYKLFMGRRRSSDDSNPDTSQQLMTTSTPSSSTSGESNVVPLPTGEYEVFLSFRGPDTRRHVTDILYRFLVRQKIRTFRDDDELRKGEEIGSNLLQAIGESKIYVVILSEGYAHSKWCLKELAEIIEHHKQGKGHIILPIFYMVDPRDVRSQTGPYQSAFQQYERKKVDGNIIQSWKYALTEVASLSGWHIKSKEEEVSVADLVSGFVWSHLNKNNCALETDEFVGVDDHIEQVVDRLNLGSPGVDVVGLHGLGGIGKTTIAMAAYNKISSCFDRFSFVENIRETQQQRDGVLVLQRKLISNILRMDSVGSIVDVNEGKKIISERASRFKILVVLDDVDEKFNFDEVLGNLNKLASGSRFIITSRNIKVLRSLSEDPSKLYEVQRMDLSCSLKLFSKHAFKRDFPLLGFEALSEDIVSTTGGLPLTLKVVGSLLFQEEEFVWKDKLEQLRKMPEKDVMDKLMISYNGLGYEAQQIFLDIACFYIGADREIPSYMWSDINFHPISNINVLVQRSMIKIGDSNEFQMHDQLRDMGREIVRQENIEHPWMRSRIWLDEEADDLLLNNKGTKKVRAIRVNSYLELEDECFTSMSELRYFDAKQTELIGDFTNLLPSIKWIQIQSPYQSPVDCMTNFDMNSLIIFDVSKLDGRWEGCIEIKEASKLKVLIITSCRNLSKLPEFPKSGSLEVLHIGSFSNSDEDLELSKLWRVKSLKLEDCELGKIKGGTFGMMKELRELNLSRINCDFDDLRQAIADVGELSYLQILIVITSHPADVLEGIKLPKSLKLLHAPSGFGNLEELLDLEELTIEGSSTTTELVIPPADSCWINSSKLKSMRLYSMKRIIMVENKSTILPSSLTRLDICNLESDAIPNLKNLSNLIELDFSDCDSLEEIQGLGGMKSLQILFIDGALKLTHIGGLANLMSSSNCRLEKLSIRRCPLLRAVEEQDGDSGGIIETDSVRIESLNFMDIYGDKFMDGKSIPRLYKFPWIKELTIGRISLNINDDEEQYQLLEGLENLAELCFLFVFELPKVQRLPSLSKLGKLISLYLYDLPGLQEIEGLGGLKSLKSIIVGRCFSLERFPVGDLPYSSMNGIDLDLRGCTNLSDIHSDLALLTTEGVDLGELEVSILWPHEPLP
ncbi:Disease resistance protein L6 [Linum grandiflorum]